MSTRPECSTSVLSGQKEHFTCPRYPCSRTNYVAFTFNMFLVTNINNKINNSAKLLLVVIKVSDSYTSSSGYLCPI